GPWPDTSLARLARWPVTPLVWSFHGVESIGDLPLVRRVAFRTAAALTSRIFAVSKAAKAMLEDLIGIPNDRIEVILNGVDTDEYSPRQAAPGAPRARFVIGSVGRLEPIKNHEMLVDALAPLVRGGVDAELRFAGTGKLEPALRAK